MASRSLINAARASWSEKSSLNLTLWRRPSIAPGEHSIKRLVPPSCLYRSATWHTASSCTAFHLPTPPFHILRSTYPFHSHILPNQHQALNSRLHGPRRELAQFFPSVILSVETLNACNILSSIMCSSETSTWHANPIPDMTSTAFR